MLLLELDFDLGRRQVSSPRPFCLVVAFRDKLAGGDLNRGSNHPITGRFTFGNPGPLPNHSLAVYDRIEMLDGGGRNFLGTLK